MRCSPPAFGLVWAKSCLTRIKDQLSSASPKQILTRVCFSRALVSSRLPFKVLIFSVIFTPPSLVSAESLLADSLLLLWRTTEFNSHIQDWTMSHMGIETCPSVSRGTKFQKSSEHSETGSVFTWAQHASDSTDHFHSYCAAFSCLIYHSLSIAMKKETNMPIWDEPSWLYTHCIESAVYTPTHTHWALVKCMHSTHSQVWACLNSMRMHIKV